MHTICHKILCLLSQINSGIKLHVKDMNRVDLKLRLLGAVTFQPKHKILGYKNISDSLIKWLSMMLTAHVHSTEQSNSGTGERKCMITKDDVSDNNCSELCYHDYIIIIFFAKKLPLQNVLEEKNWCNVIVTIMGGENRYFMSHYLVYLLEYLDSTRQKQKLGIYY